MQDSSPLLSRLPQELLVQIASHIDSKKDLGSFGATCRLLNRLSRPFLWNSVRLSRRVYGSDNDELDAGFILNRASTILPFVQKLSVSFRFAASDDSHLVLNKLIIMSCSRLRTLELNNLTLYPSTLKAISCAPYLRSLSLNQCSNNDVEAKASSVTSSSSSPLSLSLSDLFNYQHKYDDHVFCAAPELNVFNAINTSQDVINALVPNFPALQQLVIRGRKLSYPNDLNNQNPLNPAQWPKLGLLALDISSSESIDFVFSFLRNVHKCVIDGVPISLKTLIIEAHCLETAYFNAMLSYLSCLTSLKQLSLLFAQDANPRFIENIASALPQLQTLQIGRQTDFQKLELEDWPGSTVAYGNALKTFHNLEHFAWNKIARPIQRVDDDEPQQMDNDDVEVLRRLSTSLTNHEEEQQPSSSSSSSSHRQHPVPPVNIRRSSAPNVIPQASSSASLPETIIESDQSDVASEDEDYIDDIDNLDGNDSNEHGNENETIGHDNNNDLSGYTDQRRDAQILFTTCPSLKSCSVIDRMNTLNYSGPTFYPLKPNRTALLKSARNRRLSTSLLIPQSTIDTSDSVINNNNNGYTQQDELILRYFTTSKRSSTIVYPTLFAY